MYPHSYVVEIRNTKTGNIIKKTTIKNDDKSNFKDKLNRFIFNSQIKLQNIYFVEYTVREKSSSPIYSEQRDMAFLS
jgi:hypothetical protein